LNPVLFNLLNAAGIALLLLLETRSRVFRQVFSDRTRMRRNLAFLASSAGVALLLHFAVSHLNPVLPKLEWHAPLWVQIPAVFAIAELFNWVLHWAKHKNAFLWRIHCQHHRDDRYTVWLTTHTYAPEVLLSGLVLGSFLISCGFSKLALDVYLLFYSLVNLYQHSALPYSLGPLDRFIINPAYHRHHHGGAQVNFGSTLSLWDWVFGTVAWPSDRHVAIDPPPVEQSPEPFGFVAEMLYPWRPSRWVDSRRPAE